MTFYVSFETRHKLKTLYLHYQSVYGHQTRQDCNLPWWVLAHTITWHFDHVFLEDHVTNQNHYIFLFKVLMAAKVGRIVTYLERLLPIMSYEGSITWSCVITRQAITIISLLWQCLWPSNLVGYWFTLSGSHS